MCSGHAAAKSCLIFPILLSLVSVVVILVGLAGMQAACTDFNDTLITSSSPGAGGINATLNITVGGAAPGPQPQGDDLDESQEGHITVTVNDWAVDNFTELAHNISSLVHNLTDVVGDATRSTLTAFLTSLVRSSSFVTCTRIYSLHWWAWVAQLILVLACCIALCSRRCMQATGLQLLLFATTAVVLDMVICNRLVGMRSYTTPGQSDDQSAWDDVVLAGFIMACISNYLLIFIVPTLLRPGGRREGKGEAHREESAPLAPGPPSA